MRRAGAWWRWSRGGFDQNPCLDRAKAHEMSWLRLDARTTHQVRSIDMAKITEVLIPCKVSPGMFSDEYAVEIQLDGKLISLFADKNLVSFKGEQAFLRVRLVGENGIPENKTVLLPSESFEEGTRWISVPTQALAVA
jgi:hypothetical protein